MTKGNGDDYEPESLKVMLASLDRHLKANGYRYSLLKDKVFELSRKVLNDRAIELQELGKGKRSRKADPLSEDEQEE